MSVGEKLIRATQWQPLDGSASNAIPKFLVVAGSQTQKLQEPVLAFDGSGSTAQYVCYTTRVPSDYAAGGTLKLLWQVVSTSGNVKWQAQVGAVTPGDADTVPEHAWGTNATTTSNVNATEARRLTETSITLSMDSAVAGDAISFLLSRDPANDTCTAEAELISAAFQYTADDQAGSPLGHIGEARVTSAQTGITSVTDITGATVTFTALANRRYKISYRAQVVQNSAYGGVDMSITDGSNTVIDQPGLGLDINGYGMISGHVTVTPSAGSITYKLRLQTSAGSVDTYAASDSPISILVEDIGAV